LAPITRSIVTMCKHVKGQPSDYRPCYGLAIKS
jgi:hypothetical protein